VSWSAGRSEESSGNATGATRGDRVGGGNARNSSEEHKAGEEDSGLALGGGGPRRDTVALVDLGGGHALCADDPHAAAPDCGTADDGHGGRRQAPGWRRTRPTTSLALLVKVVARSDGRSRGMDRRGITRYGLKGDQCLVAFTHDGREHPHLRTRPCPAVLCIARHVAADAAIAGRKR
jgi:hypothetical protein